MNLVEYQTLSKRTMPFNGEPANQVEFEHMLGNYAMGLVGEWFELQSEIDKVNDDNVKQSVPQLNKEVAHVLHYSLGILEMLDEKVNYSKIGHVLEWHETDEHLGNILEIPKKHIYHRHELDASKLINSTYQVIAFLYDNFGTRFKDILQMNIDKLALRYPDEFSTADSIARKDVQG